MDIQFSLRKAPCMQGAFLGLSMKRLTIAFAMVFSGFINPVGAQEKVSELLQLDAMPFRMPAFSESHDIKGNAFGREEVFSYPFFTREFQPGFRPTEGMPFEWNGQNLAWKRVDTLYSLDIPINDSTRMVWALSSFAVRVPSYTTATLEVSSSPAYEVYMDGAKIGGRNCRHDSLVPPCEKIPVKLETGYHQFMVKSLYTCHTQKNCRLSVSFSQTSGAMEIGAELEEYFGIRHYLDGATLYAPQLSSSGKFLKLSSNQINTSTRKYASTHRIYDISSLQPGTMPEPIQEFTGISGLSFPEGTDRYAYMKQNGKYRQIYVGKIGQPACMVYETDRNLSGFDWAPDGSFMILSFTTSAEAPANGLKRMLDPMDQWPYYRSRTSLSILDLESLSLQPLTHGYYSTDLMDISANGKYILFATSKNCDTVRQYSLQTVYRLNLQTMESEEMFHTTFAGMARFTPDENKLLVVGSEVMFRDPMEKGVGVEGEDGQMIVNDYDADAFLFDIPTRKAQLITGDFGPSIQSMKWDANGKYIYFFADDHDFVNLYAYEISSRRFIKIPAQVDVVNGFDVVGNALVYTGSSIDKAFQAYVVKGNASRNDFASAKAARATFCVAEPQAEEMASLTLGEHQDWTFTNAQGDTIEAVYYLPPHFDASKKYPCIVYYYSGTTPTPRSLTMRYPKALWAAQGYVVLVLQPSGAIGYDREFSALHVNNWGVTVADEIIAGVRQFCQKNTFVDSTRLGCIGASYGGFMTQLLVTRTHLFAAAISHAGISSISSYWGEGYWGYLYNSVAAAFSFPWNRKDIFVEQSPLFNADKVTTPLLLLHGDADVNVPIGESYQMYKALRLLGREVEMVTIAGEDHGIVDYAKRLDWEKTILAWFEKHLKKEPLWWNTLYPEPKR